MSERTAEYLLAQWLDEHGTDPLVIPTYGTLAVDFERMHRGCSCLVCADYRAMLNMEPLPTRLEVLFWGD